MPLRKAANAIKTKIEQGHQEQLSQKIPASSIRDQILPINLGPRGDTGQGYTAAPHDHAYILIVDSKVSGTDGGTFTNGAWRTRVLTMEKADTGGHASLASNQITLRGGSYRVFASAPAVGAGRHQARLYNVTGSAVLLSGSSEAGDGRSVVQGRITLAGSTVLELQHQGETTAATTGFGRATGFAVAEEIYATVTLWPEDG